MFSPPALSIIDPNTGEQEIIKYYQNIYNNRALYVDHHRGQAHIIVTKPNINNLYLWSISLKNGSVLLEFEFKYVWGSTAIGQYPGTNDLMIVISGSTADHQSGYSFYRFTPETQQKTLISTFAFEDSWSSYVFGDGYFYFNNYQEYYGRHGIYAFDFQTGKMKLNITRPGKETSLFWRKSTNELLFLEGRQQDLYLCKFDPKTSQISDELKMPDEYTWDTLFKSGYDSENEIVYFILDVNAQTESNIITFDLKKNEIVHSIPFCSFMCPRMIGIN
ncbi:hypothetical protein M0812_02534 [Anaeramoeba flamelloides]|uniref:Uncharacterized protein n=1 Tax=Anaeramoeba flamelloides TaxID=1746091 RepID=A0AAV7YR07_9EUKA|nr:hypothetical protein M0812_02534 [Anaeramoeba flamelloides]